MNLKAMGGMIQLTGTSNLHLDQEKAANMYPDALHVVEFHVKGVVELLEGSLPAQWSQESLARSKQILQVTCKEKESEDVTSFYLKPLYGNDQKRWEYKPGQHLPIHLIQGN
jgi:hypothetical protein